LLIASAPLIAGAQSYQVLPAPPGDAKTVALDVIREAEHPCPKLTDAKRSADGSLLARCSNGEKYLVFRLKTNNKTIDVAMKCSAAAAIGVKGACS
jgi:hypothetical protein